MTMSDFAGLIRMLVRNDFDGHRNLTARLDEERRWAGYTEFLGAAFFLAVQRRFRPDQEPASIIRFVAETRAQFDESGEDIDPTASEALIWSVLGKRDASHLDGRTVGKAETVLLHRLLTDEHLSDDQLTDFLVQADDIATQWTAANTADSG